MSKIIYRARSRPNVRSFGPGKKPRKPKQTQGQKLRKELARIAGRWRPFKHLEDYLDNPEQPPKKSS